MMNKVIRIIFDGPPGPESGRFIEVEDEAGASIKVGEWRRHRNIDGWWELVIDTRDHDLLEHAAALQEMVDHLLEALKQIEHDWDGEPEDMQEARAAIQKAEPKP